MSSTLRYRPLSTKDADQAAPHSEETAAPPTAPRQAIVQGLVLLIGGLCVLTFGFLHLLGHVASKDGAGWGLMILGSLMFIPGAYVTSIALLTFCGCKGYSYSQIPY